MLHHIKIKNKKKLAINVFIFLLVIALIIFLYILNKDVFEEIIRKSFNKMLTLESGAYISIAILTTILAYQIIKALHLLLKQKPNWWVWITILFMFFTFYIGFIYINQMFGITDISFFLRDENLGMKIVGSINCTDDDKLLMVDDIIKCKISPELTNITANITFNLRYGNSSKEQLDNLSFIAPNYVERICFDANGLDSYNITRNLSICNDYHFLTKEKYEENEKQFRLYVLALFGIIFFSVPSVAVNFKKLSENR